MFIFYINVLVKGNLEDVHNGWYVEYVPVGTTVIGCATWQYGV